MVDIHRLMIAGAGAGKTTFLVRKLLETEGFSLITTFTVKNAEEIKRKIREINKGAIPNNIDILTWDSMLIRQGIKPFLKTITDRRVSGMRMVTCQEDGAPKWARSDSIDYYMTSSGLLYSDKLANLSCKCDERTGGLVIDRLTKCYRQIFIDEAQDLTGYDFEFIKKLIDQDNAWILMTCDPRQTTYNTHFDRKNKKYNDGHIDSYIKDTCSEERCLLDNTTLNKSYRCRQEICSFSSKLYEDEYPEVESRALYESTGHDGVFLVRLEDVDNYLKRYSDALQIRESRKTKVNENYPVLNMGESKGTTFNRILVYPTADMLKWIGNNTTQLKPRTKSKFYVALTRARYSVAIVCKDDKLYNREVPGVQKWREEFKRS